MTEAVEIRIREEARFRGIQKFEKRLKLTSPRIYGDERNGVSGVSADGQPDAAAEQRDRLEKTMAVCTGAGRAIAVSSGRMALWLAVRLAAERIGDADENNTGEAEAAGNLSGRRVFCPDFSPEITAAVILGCGGIPVFIDASPGDWGMDPRALEAAFEQYPDVRLVVYTHVYGFPGRIDEIKGICEAQGALLIEDASEALGTNYQKRPCGSFGDYAVIDLENAGMRVGDIGGVLLLRDPEGADAAGEKRDQTDVVWTDDEKKSVRHPENETPDVAGSDVRKLQEYLADRIRIKKRIYEKYADRLADLDIWMNPYDEQAAEPNYQVSCMMIGENGLSQARQREAPDGVRYVYEDVHGRTCPPELRDALEAFGAEGRPVWKPMHVTPPYRGFEFVAAEEELWDWENGRENEMQAGAGGNKCGTKACAAGMAEMPGEGEDIYERSLCLPSDAGMTEEEQERVIEIIYACFNCREWGRAVGDHGLF